MPDAACVLVSQIGRPVADPQAVDVRLSAKGPLSAETVKGRVGDIVRAQLGGLDELRDALIEERVSMYNARSTGTSASGAPIGEVRWHVVTHDDKQQEDLIP